MNVRITNDGCLILSHFSALEWAALQDIHSLASSLPQPFWKRPPSISADNQAMLNDWHSYVTPDIEALHRQQCERVGKTVKSSNNKQAANPEDNPASIRITGNDFDHWYGALNQARLSLEAHYQFGQNPHQIGQILQWSPEKLSRYMQSQFYQAIQINLLEMMRITHDQEFGSDFDEDHA